MPTDATPITAADVRQALDDINPSDLDRDGPMMVLYRFAAMLRSQEPITEAALTVLGMKLLDPYEDTWTIPGPACGKLQVNVREKWIMYLFEEIEEIATVGQLAALIFAMTPTETE